MTDAEALSPDVAPIPLILLRILVWILNMGALLIIGSFLTWILQKGLFFLTQQTTAFAAFGAMALIASHYLLPGDLVILPQHFYQNEVLYKPLQLIGGILLLIATLRLPFREIPNILHDRKRYKTKVPHNSRPKGKTPKAEELEMLKAEDKRRAEDEPKGLI